VGLLVDCYEYADNIFDETVHDENGLDDDSDYEKETPSSYSFLLTKRKLLLLLHNLSFAGDVAKAHFCAKARSIDVLIESIENCSYDPHSALLGAATLLSLARRGARVLAALRRGDREDRLRRCSRVLGERVSSTAAPASNARSELTTLSKASKRLGEILKALAIMEIEE